MSETFWDRHGVYGVMAEFEDPEQLVEAAKRTYAAGYRKMDAYSPMPIDGLAEAIGFTRNWVSTVVLMGGLTGCIGGFMLLYWIATIAYPHNIGGRPFNSWPMWIPITFECTVLLAALSAVVGMLAMNKLPKEWEFVPAGFSPEPLLAKAGDGYTAFGTNQAVTLEVKMNMVRGKDFFFTSFDSMGYRYYTNLVFVKRDYLAANRPIVLGYLKGLTRGWMENAKDPAVAAKLCVSKYGADLGLDLKQQTRQNELQIAMLKNPDKPDLPLLTLDRDTLAGPMYAAAKASGRENLPEIDKLCDFSVMQEVHASLKKS